MTEWNILQEKIISCGRCIRLREHCTTMATDKRKSFRDWDYWGKPVPNFGDPNGRFLIVGLAPAAHGGNRTGRVFTGDRSGDFLFEALYKTGFANQPASTHKDDGLQLYDMAITATAHCAPPENKPTFDEIANCEEFFLVSFDMMKNLQVVVALGGIAFDACLKLFRKKNFLFKNGEKISKPKFGHGAMHMFDRGPILLGCYHPSQQNTFTGKLTMDMMTKIFLQARDIADGKITGQ